MTNINELNTEQLEKVAGGAKDQTYEIGKFYCDCISHKGEHFLENDFDFIGPYDSYETGRQAGLDWCEGRYNIGNRSTYFYLREWTGTDWSQWGVFHYPLR